MYLATETTVRMFMRLSCYYKENPTDPSFVDQIMTMDFSTWKNRKAVYKQTREALLQNPLDDRTGEIKIPTLLVWGKQDKLVPVEIGEIYRSLLPGSELVIIDKSGHLLPLEKPAELNSLIMMFLSEPQQGI